MIVVIIQEVDTQYHMFFEPYYLVRGADTYGTCL